MDCLHYIQLWTPIRQLLFESSRLLLLESLKVPVILCILADPSKRIPLGLDMCCSYQSL